MGKTSRTTRAACLTLVLLFLVSACGGGAGKVGATADNAVASYTSALKTGATIYEKGMELCRDLYEAGVIDKAFRDKVIAVAWKYWAAYHAAQKALSYYVQFRSETGYAALVEAMTTFYADKDLLTEVVTALAAKGKK